MADRLVKNLKEDYLCCSICLNSYKKPKTLPCDHSFCEECLKLHTQQTLERCQGALQIRCPLCRHKISMDLGSNQRFDLETWVRGLPSDPLLESLLSTIHIHESKPPSCSTHLPLLCESHGGKPREAYCFTHARLVCWECAARNHRACEVDSAESARDVVQATVHSLRETVAMHLEKARDIGKMDIRFTDSKIKAFNDIHSMEKKLEAVYESAKQQLSLLRGEINHCTKLQLDEHKQFYDAVSQLLELNHTLEVLADGKENTCVTLSSLEMLKHEVLEATACLQQAEPVKDNKSRFVSFICDEHFNSLLNGYCSIGFIDSNVPGSGMEEVTATPRDAPLSISHILKRPATKTSGVTKTEDKKPAQQPKSLKTPRKNKTPSSK